MMGSGKSDSQAQAVRRVNQNEEVGGMYDPRIYRYYGSPKRYRDPRRSKMLDHRRRGRRREKAGASVRRTWNRAARKRLNQSLRVALSTC